MNRLTTKQLIYINESLAKLIGLESGVTDPELLEYVANAPYELRKGGDFYVYKNVVDKATKTALLFLENKPFEILNIKTGVVSSITLLELNGIKMSFTPDELTRVISALSDGCLDFDELRFWILQHVDKQQAYKLPCI